MRKRPNDVEKLDRISSAMDADKQGNVEIGKNLKIDGNLQFKSLVSDDNPDGTFNPSGTGESEIHLYDVQFLGKDNNEFYLSFASTKLLPGFNKPGDTLKNKSMIDFPDFFPKINISIPCSGAISYSGAKCPCISISIVVDNFADSGYVLPKVIYNNSTTTTAILETNKKLSITRRY